MSRIALKLLFGSILTRQDKREFPNQVMHNYRKRYGISFECFVFCFKSEVCNIGTIFVEKKVNLWGLVGGFSGCFSKFSFKLGQYEEIFFYFFNYFFKKTPVNN